MYQQPGQGDQQGYQNTGGAPQYSNQQPGTPQYWQQPTPPVTQQQQPQYWQQSPPPSPSVQQNSGVPMFSSNPLIPSPTPIQNTSPLIPTPMIPSPTPLSTPQPQPVSQSSQKAPPKINPAQVPSPVSIPINTFTTYNTLSGNNPPPTTSQFVVVDDGNASPRFMRMSFYQVPLNLELAQKLAIPFGMVIQPLADVGPGEQPVPLVDFGPSGPLRCLRCKAYINPFVVFVEGGRQYVCKFCEFANEVPQSYYSPLDASARRYDHNSRYELSRGVVDFAVNNVKDYVTRPSLPICYLFAIDVSYNSQTSGLLNLCIVSIRKILSELPEDFPVKVGLMTYDTGVQFYDLSKGPQMLAVGDVEDVFVPLSEEAIFVPYKEHKEKFEKLFNKLPTMFGGNKSSDASLGAALRLGAAALAPSGGRLIAFQSSLPTSGPGKLKKRLDTNVIGTEKEPTAYQSQNPFYEELAQSCIKDGVSVDLFLMTTSFIDSATVGVVPKLTGGNVQLFRNFNASQDADAFHNRLLRTVTRNTAYDCVARVRCSRGLTIKHYLGNVDPVNDEIRFAGLDADSSFAVQFSYDDKLDEKTSAAFQCAMLYTAMNGERRIRVINLALPVTSNMSTVFRCSDYEAVISLITRAAVREIPTKTTSFIRNKLVETVVEVLAAYRKYCATSSSAGQLILPESLKFLPLLVIGLQKHKILRPGVDVAIDERSALMVNLYSLPVPFLAPILYPRMYALHDLPADAGTVNEKNMVVFPPMVRISGENLSPDGAYLLDNGQELLLWLGRNLSRDFVQDVFRYDASITQIHTSQLRLVPVDTPLSTRIHNIIYSLYRQRHIFQPIKIYKQGDNSEAQFLNYLLEDKMGELKSYIDFLCHIHHLIQQKLQ